MNSSQHPGILMEAAWHPLLGSSQAYSLSLEQTAWEGGDVWELFTLYLFIREETHSLMTPDAT